MGYAHVGSRRAVGLRHRGGLTLATAAAGVALLASASPAGGAVGDLAYRDCISGETATGVSCSLTPSATPFGGHWGLVNVLVITSSPDGRSLYAVSQTDDAIVRFDRDPATGALTYRGCISGESQSAAACTQIPDAVPFGTSSGLDDLASVAASPDGRSVYTVSEGDHAVARFDRDPATGALTYQGCISSETQSAGACALVPGATSFGQDSSLEELVSVALSADGRSVYVAGEGDSVASFDRDPATGALAYRDCISGRTEVGAACALIPSATPDGTDSGLDILSSVAVSADGKSVYAGSRQDSAVARFDRDPATGALTYQGCISGESESGGACALIPSASSGGADSGLDQINAVTTSPDGVTLYAAAGFDDAVARFDRDPATGALTYQGCISGESESGGACALIPSAAAGGLGSGLGQLESVTVSPGGRSAYAASRDDDAVAQFSRDPATGALTYQACVSGTTETAGACAQIPSVTAGGIGSGLRYLRAAVVTPDGRSLYAISLEDVAVASFAREPELPETTITKKPKKRSKTEKAKFKFESDVAGSTFMCKLDRKKFKVCDSPRKYKRLDDGKHKFRVFAIDPFGNVDPTPARRKWKLTG